MFSKCARLIAGVFHPKHVRCLLTCAGDNPTLTIQETREKIKILVGAQKQWESQGSGGNKDVTSQVQLPVRRMKDSYREAVIPLGSNPAIKEKYINHFDGVRFGRILEDLDTFAVAIGYTHCISHASSAQISPVSIVTAGVDRISMSNAWITQTEDVKMTGKVTWTGTTSMEITMDLDQKEKSVRNKILTAKFVMVARNPDMKGPAIINKLQRDGPEEEQLFQEGEDYKDKRLKKRENTLLKTPPSKEELSLIHNLFLETVDPNTNTFKLRVKPANCTWMEDTVLKNVLICMPEQRNVYNKIFGGYLMRKAFELAWANATMLCKTRPFIEVVDDIAFRQPVEVGSLFFLTSQIVYCVGTIIQMKVHAEVENPTDGSRETTNDFYFTFNTRDTDVKTVTPKKVIPKTYAEAMLYLDGKRHVDSC